MAVRLKRTSKDSGGTRQAVPALADQVADTLAALKCLASRKTRDELGPRYGIHTKKALGVGMAAMQKLAKKIKSGDAAQNHALAGALWKTGWYEARTVAAFVEEPELITPAQMDRWTKDFDNWGICDTVCFKLFDQTPHAFKMAAKWARQREEFVRRAGFALMACLALHDKLAADAKFLAMLPLIEQGAADERNFVKKGVSWALRSIGRRSAALKAAAVQLSKRLKASPNAAARWVGADALRDLDRAAMKNRPAKRQH